MSFRLRNKLKLNWSKITIALCVFIGLYPKEDRVILYDSSQNRIVHYKHIVKPNDNEYDVRRQYCYTGKLPKLVAGKTIDIELDRLEILDLFNKYSSRYKLHNPSITNELLRYSISYQIPPCLVLAIVAIESGFNTKAKSYASAYGIMQIHKVHLSTFSVTPTMLNDYKINIPIGMTLLAYKRNRFNRSDWWVAYNTGSKFKLIQCNKTDGENKCTDVAEEYKYHVRYKMNEIWHLMNTRENYDRRNGKQKQNKK